MTNLIAHIFSIIFVVKPFTLVIIDSISGYKVVRLD